MSIGNSFRLVLMIWCGPRSRSVETGSPALRIDQHPAPRALTVIMNDFTSRYRENLVFTMRDNCDDIGGIGIGLVM